MSVSLSLRDRSYRTLSFLYPPSFRREFGEAMVQMFRDDMHERGALRPWSRVLSDLVVSVPVQQVEVIVSKRSNDVHVAQAGLATAALAVLAVVASGRYVVVGLCVVAVATATALLYSRSRLPYREAVTDAGARWWRLVLLGASILAGIAVTATYGPDVEWFPWHLAVFLYLGGWVLMIVGAVLGVLHLARRLRRHPVAS